MASSGRTTRAATLPVSFFARPAEVVARELVGCLVEARTPGGRTLARIVETEAYLGVEDPASHAWRGRRHGGNASIYLPPGTWYVYRSYGIHWCANLTADAAREGAAVLLRALEPLEGLALMRARRGVEPPRLLAAGPGRLTVALGIDRALDGRAMAASAVRVLPAAAADASPVAAAPRIGITRAADWPLRFAVPGSPWLSRPLVAGRDG